jgi:hypothetical protein
MTKPMLSIDRLDSGGLITNYYCSSRCKHCLYACGPSREKLYIDEITAERSLRKIKALGCTSIHIGGGESFLNVEGLKKVLEIAAGLGVIVEYVETNSSWYLDKESACRILLSLKTRGLDTLLISMSPFHNEYIPFYKVKGVLEACNESGIRPFPWTWELYDDIDQFDEKVPHSFDEYVERYGVDYLRDLPSRYWVHPGGRAISMLTGVIENRPLEEILFSSGNGCREILNVSHFHFDLFGNYIPGLCAGISIDGDDIGGKIPGSKYPIISILLKEGIAGFLKDASDKFGFTPCEGYLSKCHLCFEIRRYLVAEKRIKTIELQPFELYDNL